MVTCSWLGSETPKRNKFHFLNSFGFCANITAKYKLIVGFRKKKRKNTTSLDFLTWDMANVFGHKSLAINFKMPCFLVGRKTNTKKKFLEFATKKRKKSWKKWMPAIALYCHFHRHHILWHLFDVGWKPIKILTTTATSISLMCKWRVKLLLTLRLLRKLWKLKKTTTLRTGIFPPKQFWIQTKKQKKTKTRKGVELAPNRKDKLQKKKKLKLRFPCCIKKENENNGTP